MYSKKNILHTPTFANLKYQHSKDFEGQSSRTRPEVNIVIFPSRIIQHVLHFPKYGPHNIDKVKVTAASSNQVQAIMLQTYTS